MRGWLGVVACIACGSPRPFGADSGDGGFAFQEGGDAATPCVPDPANYDIPGNGCDDDGNGIIDDAPSCDTGLVVEAPDAPSAGSDFAKAVGLCQLATATQWGVVSSKPLQGSPFQRHILPKFGDVIKPREGASLAVLSTGHADEQEPCGGVSGAFKPGCSMTGPATVPPGFPKAAKGCATDSNVFDAAEYEVQIKVPKNANGFTIDFDFYSSEWPEFLCTNYNDSFIVYYQSAAFNSGVADNIAFDSLFNPVSVNNAFFDRCSPTNAETVCTVLQYLGQKGACGGGDAELAGTGFLQPGNTCSAVVQDSGGGATGWLTTHAPAQPGETITLDFLIWDTGDFNFDSTVLVDHFSWQPNPNDVGTTRPPN